MSPAQVPLPEPPLAMAAAGATPVAVAAAVGTATALPTAPRRSTAWTLVALSAFVLAAVALTVSVFVLHRLDALLPQLERQGVELQANQQRSREAERRLDELERQWNAVQNDADAAAGALTDADLRRRREQLALIDVQRVLEQLQLQLRLGLAPAIAAEVLVAVDTRLARLGGSASARVRPALRSDLARLRTTPDLDRDALAARLDPWFAGVEHWHASADPWQVSALPPTASADSAADDNGTAPEARAARQRGSTAVTLGARLRAWVSREFGDFLRIREVTTPAAILLAPAQQQMLRDRVRLGLLDLRQAILARDQRALHAQVDAMQLLLEQYFDRNQPEVAAALLQLRLLAAAAAPGAAPTLDATLAAVRLAGERPPAP